LRRGLTFTLLVAAVGIARAQQVSIHPAPTLAMPGLVDSNSPAFWRDGVLHVYNSDGTPYLVRAGNQYVLYDGEFTPIQIDTRAHFPMRIEAVWQDPYGTVYAWYHHEPRNVCRGLPLTAPQIGALVSEDGGYTFIDLGIVLTAPDAPDCNAKNGFFAGGHGDFSVILDREQRYFYFLFDHYGGTPADQGVAIARLAIEDVAFPAGAVWKYYNGEWTEPGLGGKVTPIFPATVAWQEQNTDSYWGPSIHWNEYLGSYVALMNRACCGPRWPQEGIYVTFNRDLADPAGWSAPHKVMDGSDVGYEPGWYPQVLGLVPEETDTLASQFARLYIKGLSSWMIEFHP
jgi:hypothetical protein